MQKTVLIIILMLLTLNVRAANDSISTTRENLGSFLNDSVKTLKESFFERDEELISQKENAKNLKREAEELRDNSKEAESNPRILKQGKSEIPKCDYTKQDLEWKNSKGWVCRNTEYDSDCQKVEGENKIEIGEGSGNYKCQYPDNYRYVYKKWGVCQDSIGEKHDQYACIFKVDKTGQEYQVDDLAKCGDMPQRYETPCGKYGAKSTCRCEGGASYYYKASEKKGYCASDFICEPGFSVSGGKCVTTLGAYSNSAKGAGGSASYSKNISAVGSTYYIQVWTEDLQYNIYFVDNSGKVTFHKRKHGGYDKDDNINYYNTSYTPRSPGRLFVSVTEGGSSGSGSLGYRVKESSSKAPRCERLGSVYDAASGKCLEKVPTCPLK